MEGIAEDSEIEKMSNLALFRLFFSGVGWWVHPDRKKTREMMDMENGERASCEKMLVWSRGNL